MYFILAFGEDCGTVWTLVDILVDILDSFDRPIDLQIDMTVKLHQSFPWMRNYNLVIKDILRFLDCSPIVRASIIWISILLYDGLIGKGLGKTFFACIVFQTPLRRARSMKHILGNNRVKLGMDLRIWKLCRDNGINSLNGRNLVLFF